MKYGIQLVTLLAILSLLGERLQTDTSPPALRALVSMLTNTLSPLLFIYRNPEVQVPYSFCRPKLNYLTCSISPEAWVLSIISPSSLKTVIPFCMRCGITKCHLALISRAI